MIQGNQQDGRILYKYLFIIILHINIGSFIMLFFFFSTPEHTTHTEYRKYIYVYGNLCGYICTYVRRYVYIRKKECYICIHKKKKKDIKTMGL